MTAPDERSTGQQAADEQGLAGRDAAMPGEGVRGAQDSGDGSVSYEAQDADSATEALRQELDSQRDRYLRLAAEYDNFRKRTQRERAEAGSRAQAELVGSLLEALDDLDRFAHVDPAATPAATVIQGVEMVQRKLAAVLRAAGLEAIDPQDAVFDPAVQEAMTTVPAGSPEEDHTVAQVYQRGYSFGGQLLRPARVVVRQWQE